MKTYVECIECFFKQAVKTMNMAKLNEKDKERKIKKVLYKFSKISFKQPPPYFGKIMYDILSPRKNYDYYRDIKKQSNAVVLKFYKRIKDKINKSNNRLYSAVLFSGISNLIDFGVRFVKVEKEIESVMNNFEDIRKKYVKFFDFKSFSNSLKKAKNILIVGDNAGEIVFDRIMIEEIKNNFPYIKVFYAVKSSPVLNDATVQDAVDSGINKVAEVIESGCSAPGTILKYTNSRFKKIFNKSDVVLSKGQGNFEAIESDRKNLFFLLMTKCNVVAKYLGSRVGDIILIPNKQIKKYEKTK